uniref:Fanconi anemia core complex-associated protein 100 isoform X2 n=1 Tax=Doryrhamphus excisus TaxID=161450 RepID=UPI0025AE55BF|nr:Fanconi anemia core complex-associated protein 100 isoform X2 [Doryrhamphus excisus]XP_057918546.1 Fanconi anemia core complex-associated protein 100 isoform X2 [Doryrhamphus excisus]XP_057918547.1 Fanconi anemia core complex-associated protein 100 isoform X2 [Doryrhamphus excisus]
MEGRCVVETLAKFGTSSDPCILKVASSLWNDVFLCTGDDEVYVFNSQDRKLKAVVQFPAPVSDLAADDDKQILYVACLKGVYGVCLSSLCRVQDADSSSCPSHVKVSDDHFVIGEGASALLLVNSTLLNITQRDASWLLTLYKIAEESIFSRYEMLGSFKLPVVSDTDECRRPLLLCVHSAETDASLRNPSSDHIYLEATLFKLLFGIDAALAKSPVIFFALPDGRLCFTPQRVPGSQIRVLHSLEQPVVFVGAFAGCLVAVGEQGRAVLMTSQPAGPPGGGLRAAFTEVCIPGPVVCACLDGQFLYYSTGSDLLLLDLSQTPTGGSESAKGEVGPSNKKSHALYNPTSLNVCRVIGLVPHNKAGKAQLLGLSSRGQLQKIILPERGHDASWSGLPPSHVGRSIKDILAAIGDIYERSAVLKAAIKSKNQTMQQLNQVLNISFLLNDGADRREKPIRCHAATCWSTLLGKDSLNLNCVLDNGSCYDLERGWTLSITVSPLCNSHRGESCSTHYSFPFRALHPGGKVEFSLPLASAGESSFPVTLFCSLAFSLSGLLGEDAVSGLPDGGHVSLPLNTLTVDWLHALRVIDPADAASLHCNTDNVEAFLNSRLTVGGGVGDAGNVQHSASIKVSSELLRDTLMLSPPSHADVSLLEWLLCKAHGGVKGQKDKVTLSKSVHARAPNGHIIKLTAKEAHVGSEEERLAVTEVEFESSSMAAVCGMHHAVLHRVKSLLQIAPEKSSSTVKMQSLGVREALQRSETLLQQVQQSGISSSFSGGVSTGQKQTARMKWTVET